MILRKFILREDKEWRSIIKNLIEFLRTLSRDKNWEVRVMTWKEDKTGEQRAFFHVLCKLLGDELGYSQYEIKEMIKAEALGTVSVVIGSLEREIIPSSESLKRDEYAMLIDATYRISAESGVVLPLPRQRGT